ncbi:MAG: hypothetical protein LBQ31_02755 [Bacteroidales bacterium]|jgi:hypothetical protein|nr:hypothetical protein [Bacteroidales bacterium]
MITKIRIIFGKTKFWEIFFVKFEKFGKDKLPNVGKKRYIWQSMEEDKLPNVGKKRYIWQSMEEDKLPNMGKKR